MHISCVDIDIRIFAILMSHDYDCNVEYGIATQIVFCLPSGLCERRPQTTQTEGWHKNEDS